MNTLLDIIGSTIIGTIIVMMIISFNYRTQDVSSELLRSNITQLNIIGVSEFIENDFYKIGYMHTGDDVFIIAKENEIKFYSDIDNDYSIDSVYYFYDSKSRIQSTQNPNDHPLYRKINEGNFQLFAQLTQFSITYFDSSNTEISFSDLLTETHRKRIKLIEISIRSESNDSVNVNYEATEWTKIICPKNL
ncbi:MAG: hypothetical protein GY936_01710 [Ignavibacteriae bacterium]|nr:hypothetical protein [Ignavibacteriota bacterium]